MPDTDVVESPPPANPLTIPAPGPHPKPIEFERGEPQWMNYGDIIRILGTIVVVVGHCSDMILYQPINSDHTTGPGTLNWQVCNWWDATCRWAVPIYIMLSGSLLLDPNRVESPSRFYHKRLMRIGVPLVFWSFFFMWVAVYYTGWDVTDAMRNPPGQPVYQVWVQNGWVFTWSAQSLWQWIANFIHYHPAQWGDHTRWQWIKYLLFIRPQGAWINLLKGEPYMHMHFIFRIAGLYAFTPLIRVCLRHVSRSMLTAAVITMLALSSADSIANNITHTELSAFARFVPFLGYYLIGYLLRNSVVSWKMIAGCFLGLLATIAALAVGTDLLVRHYVPDTVGAQITGPPSMEMILYDFLSPVRVVMAIFAWLMLVNVFRNPLPIGKSGRAVVRFWANTTLGLYLIHPLFREMLYLQAPQFLHPWIESVLKIQNVGPVLHKVQTVLTQWELHGINVTWPNIWVGVPFVAALVYVPSLIATIIIMRIPYVRRIAG